MQCSLSHARLYLRLLPISIHIPLLLALPTFLTGCELAFRSTSDDGSLVVVSSTNAPQLTTSTETDNTRIRFSSTGL